MGVQRTSLNRWEKGREMPNGVSMTKLRDHLKMPVGTNEDTHGVKTEEFADQIYQFTLPFDESISIEVRIGPARADSANVQIRCARIAS